MYYTIATSIYLLPEGYKIVALLKSIQGNQKALIIPSSKFLKNFKSDSTNMLSNHNNDVPLQLHNVIQAQ